MFAVQKLWCEGFALAALCAMPFVSGYTPTAFEMAHGAGVAVQSDDPLVQTDSVEDWKISIAIGRAWLDNDRPRFSGLDAQVDNGTVTVFGMVESAEDHIKALKIVWEQASVRAVQSNATFGATDNARVLAEAIRTRLPGDSAVQTNEYTVEVFNDDVYLPGRATSKAELNCVIRHARSGGNVRRAVTLVHIGNAGA
jgi:osmotically-inducible protein OsmY